MGNPDVATPLSPLDAYLDHLRVERRFADLTIYRHWRDLRQLADFATALARHPDDLDRAALETFLRQRPAAAPAVRGYYRFLVLDRRRDVSPLEGP